MCCHYLTASEARRRRIDVYLEFLGPRVRTRHDGKGVRVGRGRQSSVDHSKITVVDWQVLLLLEVVLVGQTAGVVRRVIAGQSTAVRLHRRWIEAKLLLLLYHRRDWYTALLCKLLLWRLSRVVSRNEGTWYLLKRSTRHA